MSNIQTSINGTHLKTSKLFSDVALSPTTAKRLSILFFSSGNICITSSVEYNVPFGQKIELAIKL